MRVAPLLFALLILVPACRDNTECTIGDRLCTDAEGESGAFDGTQIRECSDDESKGGDEDGEFVVIEDCGAASKICYFDFGENLEEFACLPRACIDAGNACATPGTQQCSFDRVEECFVVDSDTGCNNWVVQQDCEDSQQTCSGDPPVCG